MLILSRKSGESVVIGRDITIKVLAVRGKVVQLGFEAPKVVSIRRSELGRRNRDLEIAHGGAW